MYLSHQNANPHPFFTLLKNNSCENAFASKTFSGSKSQVICKNWNKYTIQWKSISNWWQFWNTWPITYISRVTQGPHDWLKLMCINSQIMTTETIPLNQVLIGWRKNNWLILLFFHEGNITFNLTALRHHPIQASPHHLWPQCTESFIHIWISNCTSILRPLLGALRGMCGCPGASHSRQNRGHFAISEPSCWSLPYKTQ